MKKRHVCVLLILGVFSLQLQAKSFCSALSARTDELNNGSHQIQPVLNFQIEEFEETKEFLKIFDDAQFLDRSHGASVTKVSRDGILIVKEAFGKIQIFFPRFEHTSINDSGSGGCIIHGDSAKVLFDVLLRAPSRLLNKSITDFEGLKITSIEILNKKIVCSSSIWGTEKEKPHCRMRPI